MIVRICLFMLLLPSLSFAWDVTGQTKSVVFYYDTASSFDSSGFVSNQDWSTGVYIDLTNGVYVWSNMDVHNISAVVPEGLHQVAMNFDNGAGTYDVYIDGVLSGAGSGIIDFNILDGKTGGWVPSNAVWSCSDCYSDSVFLSSLIYDSGYGVSLYIPSPPPPVYVPPAPLGPVDSIFSPFNFSELLSSMAVLLLGGISLSGLFLVNKLINRGLKGV